MEGPLVPPFKYWSTSADIASATRIRSEIVIIEPVVENEVIEQTCAETLRKTPLNERTPKVVTGTMRRTRVCISQG